jgi:hypothetical protein
MRTIQSQFFALPCLLSDENFSKSVFAPPCLLSDESFSKSVLHHPVCCPMWTIQSRFFAPPCLLSDHVLCARARFSQFVLFPPKKHLTRFRGRKSFHNIGFESLWAGVNVMILKIFAPKKCRKIAFVNQNFLLSLRRKTLILRKNSIFSPKIGDNWQK